jgi:hypothetical protein
MDTFVRQLVQQKATDQQLKTLADMSSVRIWNYELPTLTQKGRFTNRQPWNSSAEFREAFFNKFPIFESVDLSNIAVMGGAIFDFLHCRERNLLDIDLFLCGELFTDAHAGEGTMEQRILKRAEKFIDDINNYLEMTVKKANAENEEAAKKHGKPAKQDQILLSNYMNLFKATRSGPVITFHIPTVDVPIQLVLCPHPTLPDLLRRVDLDCTAIAYYQNEVYFNSISKFCYENACTIIGNNRNRNLESRISKYFDKGVDIILPHLDIDCIPQKNLKYEVQEVLDLNYVAIIYNGIVGQKIHVDRIIPNMLEEEGKTYKNGRRQLLHMVSGGWSNSAYSSSTKGKNSGVIIHENIIHLLHDLPERFQFYGDGKFVKDVLLPIPKFTNRMITNTFDTVRDELMAFKDGTLEIPVLEKYFVIKSPSQIIEEILLAPLKERENVAKAQQEGGDKEVYSLFDKEYENKLKGYFNELIHSQIRQTHEKLKEVENDFKNNPEKYKIISDLTFLAEKLDAKQWYGEKYLKK